VDTLHLTTPGVEKKNDHVIANVPIPINAEQPVRPMTLFGSIKVFDHDVLFIACRATVKTCANKRADGVRAGPSPLKSILVGSILVDRPAAVPAFIRFAHFHHPAYSWPRLGPHRLCNFREQSDDKIFN
jgi:hypothetical protein